MGSLRVAGAGIFGHVEAKPLGTVRWEAVGGAGEGPWGGSAPGVLCYVLL